MSISVERFGEDSYGRAVDKITLTNNRGTRAVVCNYGAHLLNFYTKDRHGKLKDICLGYEDLAEYGMQGNAYLGATIGRYCNRIKGASFSLNGKEYTLFANDGNNCLHGGENGFDKKWWQYRTDSSDQADFVSMIYCSHDVEEGFPGKLRVQVVFSLDQFDRLTLDYRAQCDEDTVINLTNHAYFNLSEEDTIHNHLLWVNADQILEVDQELIPTGKRLSVENSPYDLRKPRAFSELLANRKQSETFDRFNGLDTAFVLNQSGFHKAAWIYDPNSGRKLSVFTDQPGIQIYSGQGLGGTWKGGKVFKPYSGIALETQHHPDSVHHEDFESTVLRKGESFHSITVYQAEVE